MAFGGPTACATGTGPRNLAVADFNGDGKIDVAAPSTNGPVTVCLGKGDGTFQPPTSIASDPTLDIWSGDFNRDSKSDLVVRYSGSAGVGVLLGRGDGSFTAPVVTGAPGSNNANSLSVGDLDGDGSPDLFIPDAGSGSSFTFIGNRKGGFAVFKNPADPFIASHWTLIVDVSRDGRADVLTASNSGLGVWLGDGKGLLQMPKGYRWFDALGGGPESSIGTWDFDRDGVLDVIDSNGDIFIGKGDGTFEQGGVVSVSLAQIGRGIAVVDLDRDGKVDVTTGQQNSSSLFTFLGTGKGTFSPQPFGMPVVQSTAAIGVADLNKDSLPDLLVADGKANQIVAVLNKSK